MRRCAPTRSTQRAARASRRVGEIGAASGRHPAAADVRRCEQVVEAERVAQANLIRRQEETAATRSLLNTASSMENNPLLLRLKELGGAGEAGREGRPHRSACTGSGCRRFRGSARRTSPGKLDAAGMTTSSPLAGADARFAAPLIGAAWPSCGRRAVCVLPYVELAPLWYPVVGIDVSNHQRSIDWPKVR